MFSAPSYAELRIGEMIGPESERFRSDDGHNRKLPDISITRQALSPLEGELQVARISSEENYKFGWLQGWRKLIEEKEFWLRGPATIRIC